jgi:hypothetical protein
MKQQQQQKKNVPAGKQTVTRETVVRDTGSLFEKSNIRWMLIGGAVMILGFILMAGGKSDDPNVFDEKAVYSTTRITIAPILILIGFVIEIYAIFRNPKP